MFLLLFSSFIDIGKIEGGWNFIPFCTRRSKRGFWGEGSTCCICMQQSSRFTINVMSWSILIFLSSFLNHFFTCLKILREWTVMHIKLGPKLNIPWIFVIPFFSCLMMSSYLRSKKHSLSSLFFIFRLSHCIVEMFSLRTFFSLNQKNFFVILS